MANGLGETPTLSAAIDAAIDSRLLQLHTAMPGTVQSYDAATQKANVQPNIKRKFANGDVVDLPVINNVPVVWPRVGQAIIHLPMTVGSQVLLVFCERSIDTWKTGGGQTDPKDTRKHALSDAVAIPGCYPVLQPAAVTESDALQIKNVLAEVNVKSDGTVVVKAGPAMQIEVTPAGKFHITNATAEYTAAISDVFTAIMASKVATALGLQPLIPDPTYPVNKALFDTFK